MVEHSTVKIELCALPERTQSYRMISSTLGPETPVGRGLVAKVTSGGWRHICCVGVRILAICVY